MKKNRFNILLCVLLLFFSISLVTGCNTKNSPENAVKTELNLIKKLDEPTIKSFVSYEDMMRTQSTSTDIGTETTEAVHLFFQNFDYKILSSSTTDKTAIVNVQITNIDAKALAKDLCEAIIKKTAMPGTDGNNPLSMSAYFALLRDILTENTYDLVTTTAHFELINTKEGWSIQTSDELEDALVSGFISYLNDSHLISPEEMVFLTMNSLKSLTPKEWNSYLGLNDIFVTNNSLYKDIDLALCSQIAKHFDYEIKEARIQDTKAQVDVDIVSLNMEDILSVYLEKLLEYSSTTEAIRASDKELSDKTSQLLLECLNKNTQTVHQIVTLNFNNNGHNWEILLDEDFTNALIGNLSEAMETFQTSSQGQ